MIAANLALEAARNMLPYKYFYHLKIATKSSLVAIREQIRLQTPACRGC